MNEVDKLYENAEPNRDCNLYKHFTECPMKHTQCEDCENFAYPPFTAEKQLYIIKWLLKNYDIGLSQLGERIDTSLDGVNCISGLGSGNTFEESLAQAINDLWQDLTEEERKQIKEILE